MSILMTGYQYTNRKFSNPLIQQQNKHRRDIKSFAISPPYLARNDSSHQQKGEITKNIDFLPPCWEFIPCVLVCLINMKYCMYLSHRPITSNWTVMFMMATSCKHSGFLVMTPLENCPAGSHLQLIISLLIAPKTVSAAVFKCDS